MIFAFCAFQINEILDHVDGDLARYKNMKSRKGLFLEYLVDVPGSTLYGFFGLSVVIGIYRNTQNVTIVYVFVAYLIALLLNETFINAFSLRDTRKCFVDAKYSKYIHFDEIHGFAKKLHAIFTTLNIWHNQLILWSALLFWPIEHFLGINPLFGSMVLFAALNQFRWIRTVYMGYKMACREQEDN